MKSVKIAPKGSPGKDFDELGDEEKIAGEGNEATGGSSYRLEATEEKTDGSDLEEKDSDEVAPAPDASQVGKKKGKGKKIAPELGAENQSHKYRYSMEFKVFWFYIFFVMNFLVFAFVGRNQNAYRIVNFMDDYFTDNEWAPGTSFGTIRSMDELFAWLNNIFLPQMYPTAGQNGRDLSCFERQQTGDGGGNIRVGAVRIRQIRIKPNSCLVGSMFEKATDRCYKAWSWGERHEYGIGLRKPRGLRMEDHDHTLKVGRQSVTWADSSELATPSYYSWMTRLRYPGSGYTLLLPDSNERAAEVIADMYDDTFIDIQTRATFIEFTLYNAPTKNLVSALYVIETGAEGDILTHRVIKVSRVYKFWLACAMDSAAAAEDYISMLWEFFIYCMVLYETILEIKHIQVVRKERLVRFEEEEERRAERKAEIEKSLSREGGAPFLPGSAGSLAGTIENSLGELEIDEELLKPPEIRRRNALRRATMRYVFDFYNLIQLINLAFFWVAGVYRIMTIYRCQDFIPAMERQITLPCQFDDDGCGGENGGVEVGDDDTLEVDYVSCTSDFVNFQYVAYWDGDMNSLLAFNSFIVFLKSFRYLRYMPQLAIFSETLRLSFSSMGALSLILGIILVGFAIMFHIGFGFAVWEFRDFPETAQTLFKIILGDFAGMEMREINPLLAITMLAMYIVVVFMVIMSMLFAIISVSYEEMKDKLERTAVTEELLRIVGDTGHVCEVMRMKVGCLRCFIPTARTVRYRVLGKKFAEKLETDLFDDEGSVFDAKAAFDIIQQDLEEMHSLEDEAQNEPDDQAEADDASENKFDQLDDGDKQFFRSMQKPKLAIMAELVELEEDQRIMLQVIESLGKKAREIVLQQEQAKEELALALERKEGTKNNRESQRGLLSHLDRTEITVERKEEELTKKQQLAQERGF